MPFSSTRRQPSWRLYVSATFVAVGLMYSDLNGLSNWKYVQAIGQLERSNLLLGLVEAMALWPPMGSRVYRRTAEIMPSLFDGVSPQVALIFIRRGLQDDPNAPHLYFWLVVNLLRDGDPGQALEAQARLETLAPTWSQTRLAAQYLKEYSE